MKTYTRLNVVKNCPPKPKGKPRTTVVLTEEQKLARCQKRLANRIKWENTMQERYRQYGSKTTGNKCTEYWTKRTATTKDFKCGKVRSMMIANLNKQFPYCQWSKTFDQIRTGKFKSHKGQTCGGQQKPAP